MSKADEERRCRKFLAGHRRCVAVVPGGDAMVREEVCAKI